MALTTKSVTSAARRRAERAYQKVKAAELELAAANSAISQGAQAGSPELASAAVRTAQAERDVREAGKELHMVAQLLDDSPDSQVARGVSGEGLDSLLPHLRNKREQKP